MNNEKTAKAAAKKKTSRKPIAAEEKPAVVKARTETKAKTDELQPTLIMQFQGSEVDLSTLVEKAQADFRQTQKRTPVTDLKLYVKPEERAAYYVINETHSGSVSY